MKVKSSLLVPFMTVALAGTGIIGSTLNEQNNKTEQFQKDENSISNVEESLPSEGKRLLVKNENGVVSHSTDGGETWNEGAPEGVELPEKSELSPLAKEGKGILVKNENGVVSHSTDDGKTWNEGTPKDVVPSQGVKL